MTLGPGSNAPNLLREAVVDLEQRSTEAPELSASQWVVRITEAVGAAAIAVVDGETDQAALVRAFTRPGAEAIRATSHLSRLRRKMTVQVIAEEAVVSVEEALEQETPHRSAAEAFVQLAAALGLVAEAADDVRGPAGRPDSGPDSSYHQRGVGLFAVALTCAEVIESMIAS